MSEQDNIKDLEAQLVIAIEQDARILADDGRNPTQHIIDKYAAGSSLYTDKDKLQKMINELQAVLKRQIENAGKDGTRIGKTNINKFITDSEVRAKAAKANRIILNLNAKRARQRLDVALTELAKEKDILAADIKIFKKNAKLAGYTDKEILSQLVIAGKEKTGIAQGFAKRTKRVAVDAVRRERSASEIDEFRKIAGKTELWQWVAVSTKPCPDCDARAGRTLSIEQWERIGLPGSGRTICGRACKCLLMPASVGEERFPNTKAMKFDTKKLVLTTAWEERTLNSKKATGGK